MHACWDKIIQKQIINIGNINSDICNNCNCYIWGVRGNGKTSPLKSKSKINLNVNLTYLSIKKYYQLDNRRFLNRNEKENNRMQLMERK